MSSPRPLPWPSRHALPHRKPPAAPGRRWATALALLAAWAAPTWPATRLADQPLAANTTVPGNLAMALSVEYPTAVSVAHPDSTYTPATTYLGYFDPAKCYAYRFVDVESSALMTHFAPAGLATAHACSGRNDHLWSGNYLNWATMQTIDPFRWALTGGYRVVDTAGTPTAPSLTILEKAWASGQGGTANFPDRVLSNATDIANATPFAANGNFTAFVQGRGNRVNFVSAGVAGTGGLLGTYFNGTNLDYDSTPATPVLTRTERVNFDWGAGSPLAGVVNADYFSARWVSSDVAPSTGVYTFQIGSDNGMRLWVNGELLIDAWTEAVHARTATVSLTAGAPLNVRFEYFESWGTARVKLEWKRPGDSGFSVFDANGGTWLAPVRVKVCDASAPGSPNGLESNCKAYTNGYKPEGLMQSYADRIRYSVFGYLNDSNINRDAGVLRAPQKFIGPTYALPGQAAITNTAAEWDPVTGVYLVNPDGASSAMGVSISNSGAMNYLNKFGQIVRGGYKGYDPVSELFYATLRYYRNLGNVPAWSDQGSADAATRTTWADGFPVITSWNDPILYSCQKNFILGIGDVNTHADKNVPGPTGTAYESSKPSAVVNDPSYSATLNAVTTTNQVGVLQGLGNSLGTTENYNGCCSNNAALMAGLAYDANIRDIRPDDASVPGTIGKQTVQTYWLDVQEYQTYKSNNQFYLAAKYGGFKAPDNYAAGTPLQDDWWRTNTDLVGSQPRPDNYFIAGRPDQMVAGLTQAFRSIASAVTSAVASNAVPQPQVAAAGGNISYSATWSSANWTGELVANELTYTSGGSTPVLTSRWSLSKKLQTQLADTGWNERRRVATWNPSLGRGVPFRLDRLSASQQNALSASYQSGFTLDDYLNYLRGDRRLEGNFRPRASLLGDIVGGRPVVVGPPSLPLSESSNPGYTGFKRSLAARPTVVYFGANDGMLHAVNGNLVSADGGQELFAYVPGVLFAGPTDTPAVNGLAALGNPAYTHRAYVDSPPNVYDIDLGGSVGWRSVLIGGLGKGGKAYYALDVTDPVGMSSGADNASAEANVAAKVLWEFTDPRLGYTYGQPAVVKTRQHGWVVIVPSGYNNADGQGHFFILNARTGALIQALPTGAGDTARDAGLAQLNAFVLDRTDGTADAVYAGDLLGNLWRVDLTPTSGPYPAPLLMARLTDPNGSPQPVTVRPLIEVHPVTKRRHVLVGTGRLLDQTDASTSQVQSHYAIIDGTNAQFNQDSTASAGTRLPTGIRFPITRSQLVTNLNPVDGVSVDNVTKVGWALDLGSGWRQVSDSATFFGTVSFAAVLPNSDACTTSNTRFYSLDFDGGKSELLVGPTPTAYLTVEASITDIQNLSVSGQRHLTLGLENKKVIKVNTAPLGKRPLRRLNWREVPVAN